jgi:hypothetical protein
VTDEGASSVDPEFDGLVRAVGISRSVANLRPMAEPGPDRETDDGSSGAHRDGSDPTETPHGGDEPSHDVRASDGDAASEHEDGDGDDSDWEFGLDEVGPGGRVDPEPEPLEPGDPTLENVFFVLLGAAGTLLLLSTVV